MKKLLRFVVNKGIRSLGILGLAFGALSISSPAIAHPNHTIFVDTILTGDHTENFFIGTDGIILDCAGHTVIGSGVIGTGITLFARSGVTVKNCVVTGFQNGILLFGGSSGNTLEGNTVVGLGNRSGRGFLLLNSSNDNTLRANTATNNADEGFRADNSSGNTFQGNTASNNGVGGFSLLFSDNNTIEDNTAEDNGATLFSPPLIGTGTGFFVLLANGNTLQGNTARNNKGGFAVTDSSGNLIFHNNIIGSSRSQSFDNNSALNDWHHPGLLEGNFWSDYTGVDDGSGTGKHAIAGDGIGDTRIPHPRADADNFPFLTEFGQSQEVDIDVAPLLLDFGDVEAFTSLDMIVTISNTGAIPHEVSEIALSGDPSFTAAPLLPIGDPALVLTPGDVVDIVVTFFPTDAEAALKGATLTVSSDDPDASTFMVSLIGNGLAGAVEDQATVLETVIDETIAAGTLVGDGPGKAGGARLNAFTNMVEAAGDLIEAGLIDDACGQLKSALKRVDNNPRPPDFVTGDEAALIAAQIQFLLISLKCN